VSDLQEPGERTGPWWGHGKGKIALDHLYSTGALTIRGRTPNFVSIYDIPERVFDRILLSQHVPEHEAHRQLMVKAVQAHGVGTLSDLADYFRLSNPEARPRLAELLADGLVEEVQVEGWKQAAYIDPSARLPRKISGQALLAPFDPLIWHRERTERLFGFRYRIEIYVPEPQRQFGYYVYPFLLDGELVARVDLKADRKAGVLRVLGSFVEKGVEDDEVGSQLAIELRTMAQWLGLGDIAVSKNGNLSMSLRSEF
ncbi:MAG: winged helix DNA-binding domain-containing protein, partial [Acidimicrobiia bacterium]|nr:winged helix DNA-binding domain-containing protein [Acidimicrobiia bacterium]NNL28050.1 winged helix-turn-helix domain-containing protein [Acidimicrobiia bacterium]